MINPKHAGVMHIGLDQRGVRGVAVTREGQGKRRRQMPVLPVRGERIWGSTNPGAIGELIGPGPCLSAVGGAADGQIAKQAKPQPVRVGLRGGVRELLIRAELQVLVKAPAISLGTCESLDL